jgi:hypothetical protein
MLLSAVISTLHNHLYHTQKTGKISTQHNGKLKVDTQLAMPEIRTKLGNAAEISTGIIVLLSVSPSLGLSSILKPAEFVPFCFPKAHQLMHLWPSHSHLHFPAMKSRIVQHRFLSPLHLTTVEETGTLKTLVFKNT